MEISKINTTNKKITFGAIPLYRATIFQRRLFSEKRPIEAIVSLMEKSDLDKPFLKIENWENMEYGWNIFDEIIKSFCGGRNAKKGARFLFVDLPQEAEQNRVKAIGTFHLEEDSLFLDFLQSKKWHGFFNRTKGAGSLILYALSKFAGKLEKRKIKLDSALKAESFYKKAGFLRDFERKGYTTFSLEREQYPYMQKKLEKKYNITPIANEENISI